MPVAIAFTVTAAVAVLVHSWYLRRVYRNRERVIHSAQNGGARRWANAFVNVESTRFVINACVLLAGFGALSDPASPGRLLVWLLAAIPVISIASSTLALWGFD